MIGFHMQSAVRDWPNAVKLLPDGTWIKSLNDQHLLRDVKAINPKLKTAFRYEFNKHQSLQGDYHDLARDYFSRFIDGTFYEQELYLWMDAIEEWNEYLANSQDPQERAKWLAWCTAVNEVWTNEYRSDPRLSHIRLVSCNTAIGNDIPIEFADVVNEHDGILGYHNYTNVYKKGIVSSDFEHYSGRWIQMDSRYRAAGIYINWLFTEGGPTCIGTYDGRHYAGVTEGWRHAASYNGDLAAYVDGAIAYQLQIMSEWNIAHGGRCLGGVLFTSENNRESIWKNFHLFEPEMVAIAQMVAAYSPTDPSPRPPDWQGRAWQESVKQQVLRGIQLNPQAALQRAILAAGLIPVQNEFVFEGRTWQAAESLDGSQPRRLYYWAAGEDVDYIEDPYD